jgi:hypothetical protein
VLEPKDEMKELRKQIDDAVETMFRQPGGPEKAPHLLADVQKEVERLGRIYKSQVWDMALTDQQEKDVRRFLHKVRAALLAAADAAAYDSELKTKAKPGSQYGSGGQPQTQGQYPAQSSAPMQEPVPAPATQPVGPNVAPQAPAGNLPNQPSTQPNQPKQPPNQPSPQPKPPSQPKPKGPPPVKEKQ